MEHHYSNLFLIQHLTTISHQKIYPPIQSKIELPLWKTLHITRLWNHAREQEIYLIQQQQQQQKNDPWFQQMTGGSSDPTLSHQMMDDYLPSAWFDDDTTPIENDPPAEKDETEQDDKKEPIDTQDKSSLLSHTSIEWATLQDRKRKHEDEQEGLTGPPATRMLVV